MALVALPFGLAIGLSLGMLGGGGSVLAVPVLVYILGQSIHQATTTSLLVVTVGALVGGLGHAREGRACWRHAATFTAAALPGVLAGTALGQAVSGSVMLAAFALLMLAATAATWRKANGEAGPARTQDTQPSCLPLRLARNLIAGALIGTLTGFVGVGGGFLIVPALAVGLALPLRLAVGTSLAIITTTSMLALIAHLLAGRTLNGGLTAAMTAACLVGALAGVGLAGRMPQRQLAAGFAALVVVVASYLLVSATLLGGPPGSS